MNNNATLEVSFEGAGPTYTSIGGGQGASNNTDIFLAGNQSGGRRVSNATTTGFWANQSTGAPDLSGQHVKFYVWVTHYSVITAAEVRIGSDTSNYETHTLTVSEYPPLGGFWPVWVEVDSGTDTGTPVFTAADEFAVAISIPSVGGNAQNLIMDQIHYSSRPVLSWTGSTGTFADLVSTDDTNKIGAILDVNGALFLYANVQLGGTFSDSGVTILAPEFSHLPTNSTWQGIDIDLTNVTDDVTWTDSVYGAADPTGATRKPDLIATGTDGTADISRNQFPGLRIADLTSAVTANDCTFTDSGRIDAAGADLSGTSISGFTGAAGEAAVLWDVATNPSGLLDNMSFTKGSGTVHAIAFGTSSPLTIDLRGHSYSGYNASNGQNDSTLLIERTTGTVTINVLDGGDTPSYRSLGAIVDIVNAVPVQVTVVDAEGNPIEDATVYLRAASGGALPAQASVTITRSGSTATVTHTAHGLSTGDLVAIEDADQGEYNGAREITVTGVNTYTYTVSGTPTTPATGSIVSSKIILFGRSDSLGVLSDSGFPFTANQPVTGWARRGTISPLYKTGPINGTITNIGFSGSATLVTDEG